MFISIPTNAHRSSYKINIKITPTGFGVLTPSSGSLQVLSAKVMKILNDKIQYSTMSLS
jgi:hypothetical protein